MSEQEIAPPSESARAGAPKALDDLGYALGKYLPRRLRRVRQLAKETRALAVARRGGRR